jgi:SMC interacting uncharacterized protein involved in chromosome segregation
MEIKEAIEIIKDYERENDVDRLQEEIEDKESQIDDLSDEISNLQSQIESIEDMDFLEDDDEVKVAYRIIEDGKKEVERIKDAINSGVVKNTRLAEIQLKEFEEQLKMVNV